jgi:SAM-dependent methyltransferase
MWPTVRAALPAPPATIVELGCGRLGGFVPRLLDEGYRAVGIDPAAPEGEAYRRIEFERSELPPQLDAVVACTSLHHVTEPREALDKIAGGLSTGGLVVVVEWDWESFDEATAEWCTGRLGPPEGDGWLQRHHAGWTASGLSWEDYLRDWTRQHGVHSVRAILRELDRRFHRVRCERGPYLFPDLVDTTEADEREAISGGLIQATRIDWVGRR